MGELWFKTRLSLRDTWEDLVTGFTKKYGAPSERDDAKLVAKWWFPKYDKSKEQIDCQKVGQPSHIIRVSYMYNPILEEWRDWRDSISK